MNNSGIIIILYAKEVRTIKHTLESIAKLAGVSRGTVSRVVNNQPGVNEDVRKKVEKIIEETGYRPNPQARVLAGGTTNNIGVIVFANNPHYLFHHLFYEVLQGIQSHSTFNEYDLLLFANRHGKDINYWKRIADVRKIDGLIIMGEYIREEYLRYYRKNDLPFVLVGKRNIDDLPLQCVTSDYRKGARDVTTHLIKQGRRDILFIRGIPNSYHEAEKLAGYKEALSEAGISFRPDYIVEGNAEREVANRHINELLKQHHVPFFDGIFAGNDLMAFGAIDALKEHGYAVPADVSIAGYDDIQQAATFNPPLTTVRQHKRELGSNASKLLVKLLKEKNKMSEETIIVDNELVIRDSSVVKKALGASSEG